MSELKLKLKEQLIEHLNLEDFSIKDIADDLPLFGDELGLDSIDALEIIVILEKRFNVIVQRIASFTFLFTRVLADAVRFAAIAIVIQSITSLSITLSILIVGLVTLIYTVLGGLKTVIHIDVFQFFIYILSAFNLRIY